MLRYAFSLLCVAITFHNSQAQLPADTIRVTLPEAEKLFLQRNLALLSHQYNIDISKALEQQARYWDNPVLTTDQTLYDGKFFRHATVNDQEYGQFYAQLQQVVKTAGNRNKLIQLAQDQTLTTQQAFNDLLRNLKFVLTTDFNTLHQLSYTNSVYTNEIAVLQQLVTGMDAQWKADNISQKDNVRIKALLFSHSCMKENASSMCAFVTRKTQGPARKPSRTSWCLPMMAPKCH